MTNDDTRVLTSWKEIASFLDVTVRTAQLWEKQRGLPVRRMPGPRSRVFLRIDEYEAWLEGQGDEEASESRGAADGPGAGVDPNPRTDRRRETSRARARLGPRRVGFVLASGAFAIMAVLVALSLNTEPSSPAAWRVVRNSLVVEDELGRDLWVASLDDDLRDADYETVQGLVEFVDFERDGRIETLFLARYDGEGRSQELICFDENGDERWRFRPGRSVETTKPFLDVFGVGAFRVLELGEGRRGVVVTGFHSFEYPTQVAVLSTTDGKTIAEYWHSGHIGASPAQLQVADANGDGRSEIYLVGVNNERRLATFVALDPETMQGASREKTADYQLRGFAEPRELARIVLGRSSLSWQFPAFPFNVAADVSVAEDAIVVGVHEGPASVDHLAVHYVFRHDFVVERVSLSSSFLAVEEALIREGKIQDSEARERELMAGVQYVGGQTPLPRQMNSIAATVRLQPEPAEGRVAGNELVIEDAAGHELWRRHFDEVLDREPYAHDRFQPQLVDVDGNGEVEVLFIERPADYAISSTLICFSANGEELWRFVPGGEVATRAERFEDNYRVVAARAVELREGSRAILVSSIHSLYYPTQITLLTPGGEKIADYWHAGHIGQTRSALGVVDLNDDGSKEIYAVGINNAREVATLVLLDPATMAGAGREDSANYSFVGMETDNEIARVFFPRTSMNKSRHRFNEAVNVLMNRGSIAVQVLEGPREPGAPSVFYHLNARLDLLKISLSDTFIATYRGLLEDGVVTTPLAAEERRLNELGVDVQHAELVGDGGGLDSR